MLSRVLLRKNFRYTAFPRLLPNRNTSTDVAKATKDGDARVQEEEVILSETIHKQILDPVPIKSFNVVANIEKVKKPGSFAVDMFTGKYDPEFLIYPDVLDNREQNKAIKHQAAMVNQLYPQIWNDEFQLQKYNFFNLYQLSVSEMMTIFESIGASARDCYEMEKSTNMSQSFTVPPQTKVSKAIISLIIRNCLTYWPIHKSTNEYSKIHLPQKDILFGGLAEENSNKLVAPIGFGWTEQAEGLGALPPQEWLTVVHRGDTDTNACIVKGRKTKVLFEEATNHFLIFFKDKLLSEKYTKDPGETQPNPASDPFVGCALLDKSQVQMSDVYLDSTGCEYVDLDIDQLVPESQIVFHAQRKDPHGVNIKALGQLATSAVVMGMLKDTLKMTYQQLLRSKTGLLECDIIQRKLTGITSRIFALESMVYYIAGMYDGLEHGFDAHMEATILKVVTNEYAFECLKDIQHIFGPEMFLVSKLQDQINTFDSFLDGNIYNRLYLSTMGILWFARSKNMHLNHLRMAPWYPGYFVKSMIRERSQRGDLLTLDADIRGHLHPSLTDAALNLEYIVKRIKYAAETLLRDHGANVISAQNALYKMAQLSIDSFMLTAVCARASKSYSNGSRNSEIDIDLASAFARAQVRECRLYMDDIENMAITGFDSRTGIIHEMNLKAGGYFAESPLDTNI